MIYLTLPELMHVARRVLGPEVGVRDYGLLEAALARPKATAFGKDAYPSLDAKAAALLHSLARNHARGRFFLNHVTPAIRAVIEDGGHTINDHTRDHLAMNTMSNAQIAEQISGGPRTTAGAPKVLRPPYGAGAEASRIVERIAAAGYATCRWSVDTRDWAGYTPAQMADAVRYGNSFTPPVHAGGVILMHATHFSPAKLQAVIDAVHARGLAVA